MSRYQAAHYLAIPDQQRWKRQARQSLDSRIAERIGGVVRSSLVKPVVQRIEQRTMHAEAAFQAVLPLPNTSYAIPLAAPAGTSLDSLKAPIHSPLACFEYAIRKRIV